MFEDGGTVELDFMESDYGARRRWVVLEPTDTDDLAETRAVVALKDLWLDFHLPGLPAHVIAPIPKDFKDGHFCPPRPIRSCVLLATNFEAPCDWRLARLESVRDGRRIRINKGWGVVTVYSHPQCKGKRCSSMQVKLLQSECGERGKWVLLSPVNQRAQFDLDEAESAEVGETDDEGNNVACVKCSDRFYSRSKKRNLCKQCRPRRSGRHRPTPEEG